MKGFEYKFKGSSSLQVIQYTCSMISEPYPYDIEMGFDGDPAYCSLANTLPFDCRIEPPFIIVYDTEKAKELAEIWDTYIDVYSTYTTIELPEKLRILGTN